MTVTPEQICPYCKLTVPMTDPLVESQGQRRLMHSSCAAVVTATERRAGRQEQTFIVPEAGKQYWVPFQESLGDITKVNMPGIRQMTLTAKWLENLVRSHPEHFARLAQTLSRSNEQVQGWILTEMILRVPELMHYSGMMRRDFLRTTSPDELRDFLFGILETPEYMTLEWARDIRVKYELLVPFEHLYDQMTLRYVVPPSRIRMPD